MTSLKALLLLTIFSISACFAADDLAALSSTGNSIDAVDHSEVADEAEAFEEEYDEPLDFDVMEEAENMVAETQQRGRGIDLCPIINRLFRTMLRRANQNVPPSMRQVMFYCRRIFRAHFAFKLAESARGKGEFIRFYKGFIRNKMLRPLYCKNDRWRTTSALRGKPRKIRRVVKIFELDLKGRSPTLGTILQDCYSGRVTASTG